MGHSRSATHKETDIDRKTNEEANAATAQPTKRTVASPVTVKLAQAEQLRL